MIVWLIDISEKSVKMWPNIEIFKWFESSVAAVTESVFNSNTSSSEFIINKYPM